MRNNSWQNAWLPDKGDLIVHRLELRRGKQVIDLLAQGVKPEVIRRESELEQRSLDGMLTALVKVPGAQVGFGPEAAGLLRPGPEPLPVQAPVDQFVAQEAVQVSPAQALQGPQVQHIAHPGRIPPGKAPRGPVEGGIVQVHPHGPGANRPGTEGFGAPPSRLQGRLQPQGRVGIPLEDRRRRS